MDFSYKTVDELIMLRNGCVCYRNNLKTKQDLYNLFSLYGVNVYPNIFNNTDKYYINKVIETIESELYEKCHHEWVQEWIDISIDESKKVTYCMCCEITKK